VELRAASTKKRCLTEYNGALQYAVSHVTVYVDSIA